jgi:NAD(P)-dependent dehydrogenase (short-subunit alcohol dehydrogenase family)
MSRRVLVTGGNKGIGLAICKAILKDHADTAVLLGSRDAGRGKAAVSSVISENPSAEGRIEMLLIDTSSDESCKAAAASVTKPLYAIVNNAGIVGETDEMLQVLPLFTSPTPTPSLHTSPSPAIHTSPLDRCTNSIQP